MATADKYDRQLRLWGAQGQRALGNTRVLSIGTSSAGTETLKNLVLPGIGAFTVMDFVDDNHDNNDKQHGTNAGPTLGKVTEADASTNFFLPKHEVNFDESSKTKAEAACKYLMELNPDVIGNYRNLSLVQPQTIAKMTNDSASSSPPPSSSSATATAGGPNTSDYWKTIFLEEELRDIAIGTEEESNPKNLNKKKLLVVAADISPPCILEALADACYNSGHPLVIVTSYGLIGSVRLQLPGEGAILLQPKATNSVPDLRLVTSFPSFRRFVDSIDLNQLDNKQHGHVPYPVILMKAADRYHLDKSKAAATASAAKENTTATGRFLPKTFNEKQKFVNDYVKSMARDYDKELNFQEAVANAYLAYTERELNFDMSNNGDSDSKIPTKLRSLQSALEVFMKDHPDQRPPLKGVVPDMTASTLMYIQLQKLYRDQAEEDVQKMTDIIIGRQQKDKDDNNNNTSGGSRNAIVITKEDVSNFCSNVYSVGYLQTRSIREEYHGPNDDDELVDDWKMALMDPYEVAVHTPLLWYLGLRAAQIFCDRMGHYPGCVVACGSDGDNNNCTLKKDEELLTEIMRESVIPHYKLSEQELLLSNVDDSDENNNIVRICKELTRYGNAEIHTVSSVVGGVASQECVKIVTEQYTPLDNTYVYNGIVSVGGVYKF